MNLPRIAGTALTASVMAHKLVKKTTKAQHADARLQDCNAPPVSNSPDISLAPWCVYETDDQHEPHVSPSNVPTPSGVRGPYELSSPYEVCGPYQIRGPSEVPTATLPLQEDREDVATKPYTDADDLYIGEPPSESSE